MLTADAEGLIARAQNTEIKAECKKVYDAVRYSDPMSNSALLSIENEISIKFTSLTSAVADGDIEEVKKIADEVTVLVGDRNRKCKAVK